MDKERFLQSGLLEQYVLGLTNEEESGEVERYARAFPEIQSEIDLLRNAVQQYAEEQIGTPRTVKTDTTNSNPFPETGQPPRAPSANMLSRWLMAACLVISAGFGLYHYTQAQNSEAELVRLNDDLITAQTECEKDKEDRKALQKEVAFYRHNRTQPVLLTGTERAPNALVRVFWNELENAALLQVFFLPDHPEDKQYQIWADIKGKMVDLGVIEKNSERPQTIRCFPHATSLNITLEPHGGSSEPHVNELFANVDLP